MNIKYLIDDELYEVRDEIISEGDNPITCGCRGCSFSNTGKCPDNVYFDCSKLKKILVKIEQ